MSIVDRLQAIARERGTTFKQLEREIGLGNGTIRRWEDQSPRLDKLTKVADYLHVSLDYLVYGRSISEPCKSNTPESDLERVKKAQGLTCDGSPLDNIEADLVAMFRLLPEEEREDVFDIVHLKYKRRLSRKQESIYWTYFDENSDEQSGPAEGREAQDGTA